ncbi:MAG: hypothetical protein D6801_01710, partial [Alphaproteobacteria bacterium]
MHVGDHKAGSTAIQSALARGEVRLKEGRLVYPTIGARFNHNHLKMKGGGDRAAGLLRGRLGWPGARGGSGRKVPGFAEVAARARKSDPDVTVLSGESLEAAPPARLAAALARHFPVAPGRLTVISYLRPHASRAISGLAETIKIGWAGADPWAARNALITPKTPPARRVAAWRKAFGAAYVARPLVRSELAQGNLLEDLFATALGPGKIELRSSPTANESLGVEDLMRLQVIHLALP